MRERKPYEQGSIPMDAPEHDTMWEPAELARKNDKNYGDTELIDSLLLCVFRSAFWVAVSSLLSAGLPAPVAGWPGFEPGIQKGTLNT